METGVTDRTGTLCLYSAAHLEFKLPRLLLKTIFGKPVANGRDAWNKPVARRQGNGMLSFDWSPHYRW